MIGLDLGQLPQGSLPFFPYFLQSRSGRIPLFPHFSKLLVALYKLGLELGRTSHQLVPVVGARSAAGKAPSPHSKGQGNHCNHDNN
ncbi:MAG: hypothetical protein OXB92_08740 [Acidimicrobiaceae bacterium]|nr:hypothetical protein [Acidimicrobiaceae bacterium]